MTHTVSTLNGSVKKGSITSWDAFLKCHHRYGRTEKNSITPPGKCLYPKWNENCFCPRSKRRSTFKKCYQRYGNPKAKDIADMSRCPYPTKWNRHCLKCHLSSKLN